MLESPSPPNDTAFRSHPGWRDPHIACPPPPYRSFGSPPTPPPERVPYVYSSLTPPSSLLFSRPRIIPQTQSQSRNESHNEAHRESRHESPLARYSTHRQHCDEGSSSMIFEPAHEWMIPTEANRMELDRVGNDDRYFPPTDSLQQFRHPYLAPLPNPFARRFSLDAEIPQGSETGPSNGSASAARNGVEFHQAAQSPLGARGQVETGFDIVLPPPISTVDEQDIPSRLGATPFVTKLHFALEHPQQYGDVLRWTQGGLSFFVCLSNPRFAVEVLPKLFSHDSLTSFTRQLSIYSFTRLPTSKVLSHLPELSPSIQSGEWRIFQHPNFQKIDTSTLHLLRPRPSPARKVKQDLAALRSRAAGGGESDEG